jgi:hypothetical protein
MYSSGVHMHSFLLSTLHIEMDCYKPNHILQVNNAALEILFCSFLNTYYIKSFQTTTFALIKIIVLSPVPVSTETDNIWEKPMKFTLSFTQYKLYRTDENQN